MATEVFRAHRRASGEEVDFPVEWPALTDAEQRWYWNNEQWALPLTPLALDHDVAPEGIRIASAFFGGDPFVITIEAQGYRFRRRTAESFVSTEMAPAVAARAGDIQRLWTDTWRWEIESDARKVWSRDYGQFSLAGLVTELEERRTSRLHHFDLLFRSFLLVEFPLMQLSQLCSRYLGERGNEVALSLTQGVENVSLESNISLWDLAQRAKASPDVAESLLKGTGNEAGFRSLSGGNAFLSDFHAWLETHGLQSDTRFDFAYPSWFEDWSTPLSMLSRYLTSPSPREAHEVQRQRREELTGEVDGLLPSPEEKAEFRRLSQLVLHYVPTRESRALVSNMSKTSMRKPSLEFGQRLATSGIIERPDDIFFLRMSELQKAAEGGLAPAQTLIQQRRADHEYWSNVVPPEFIGQGGPARVHESELKGTPASTGECEGFACVAHTLEDAQRLRPGDILVTRSTAPPWAPLFSIAAAVITESGGLLSHCAIVAREARIPAVVGARGATELIPDGAYITVNGTTGEVRVLSSEGDAINPA